MGKSPIPFYFVVRPGRGHTRDALKYARVSIESLRVAVAALELKFWESCCDLLRRPDLKSRYWSLGEAIVHDAMAVRVELDPIVSTRSQPERTAVFEPADRCVTPVLTTDEFAAHRQITERGVVLRATHDTEGGHLRTGPALQLRW